MRAEPLWYIRTCNKSGGGVWGERPLPRI